MRQFKFRVWDGKCFRGNLHKYFMNLEDGTISEVAYSDLYEEYYDASERGESLAIQQWTGLIDKKGKKIYEGDILERIGNGSFCKIVVSWNDKECCFVYNTTNNLYGSPSPLHDNFVNLCDWTYWVVCGNIFQTPNLLK